MLSSHFIDEETEAQTGYLNLPNATQSPGVPALCLPVLLGREGSWSGVVQGKKEPESPPRFLNKDGRRNKGHRNKVSLTRLVNQ